MSRSRVLVTHRLPSGVTDELPDGWQVWEGDGAMPPTVLLQSLGDLKGLLCMLVDPIDADLIGAGTNLAVISQMAVGVDNIDLAAATRAGIPVGHTPNVLSETTADTAFALMAAAARRLPEGQAVLRTGQVGEWDPEFLLGGDLHATTIGIVGFGRIGQAIARRAAGFDMEVLYAGPRPKPDAEAESGAVRVSLDQLLSRADHVVLAASLGDNTRHLIDGPALDLMSDGAVLVNIGRGGLVDHDALTSVAATGRIRVALDVTEPEPLPPDHPLLAMPNVLVVPHLGSASVRTRRAMARLAVDNLLAGLAGERLPACANPEVYG